ncbi:MAG: hypothetical protein Q8P76_03170 [bacterium]|nr:hypothetical protein [bacterium]
MKHLGFGTFLVPFFLTGCASVSQNTTPESPWQENAVIAKINSLPTDISVYKIERNQAAPGKITTSKGKITNFTIELLTNSGRTLKYQYRDLEIKYISGQRVVIVYLSEESQKNGKVWYLKKFY